MAPPLKRSRPTSQDLNLSHGTSGNKRRLGPIQADGTVEPSGRAGTNVSRQSSLGELARGVPACGSKPIATEGLDEASWDSWRLLFLEKMEPWQTTSNPRNAGTRRSFGSGPSGWCSKPMSRAVSASA